MMLMMYDNVADVAAPAYDITVNPRRRQYAVNDVITCSAKGFPAPAIQWIRRGSTEETASDDDVVHQSNLTVTDQMMETTNHWTCTAQNDLNVEPLSLSIDFTVTGMSSVCLSDSLSVCLSVSLSLSQFVYVWNVPER